MKRRKMLVLLLGGLLLLAGCGGSGGGDWQTFEASDGGFVVSMPGKPVKNQESLATAVGPLESYSYIYAPSRGKTSFGVDYADYPREVVARNDPERVIDSARDALVTKVRGRLLRQGGIAVDGNPGRELDVALTDGQFVRARIFLVGQRQFQVVAVTPDERTGAADATRFLDSFRLRNR